MDEKDRRQIVRETYARIARSEGGCGDCAPSAQQGVRHPVYSQDEIALLPLGADLGLGCGNPTAIAGLREGEVALDLGCGAGIDCFLAAHQVGPRGRAIGVDMTPEMVERARRLALQGGFSNVEFLLAEIEELPLGDASVDVIISNCVINLSTDKPRVFREAYRVLRPGGRLAISDIALLQELPPEVRESTEAYAGCLAGAVLVDDYRKMVEEAGFQEVRISIVGAYSCGGTGAASSLGQAGPDGYAVSVYVEGYKR